MNVKLEIFPEGIRIIDPKKELTPATKSALGLQGFLQNESGLFARNSDYEGLVMLTINLLRDCGAQIEFDSNIEEIIRCRNEAHEQLQESRKQGEAIKKAEIDRLAVSEFMKFLENGLKRPLLSHQVKAALHLLSVAHGANFSVPGAGKTSVVLAVYEFLRSKGNVTSLFVVGPRSCFMPWRTEFELTLGRPPRSQVLAGGNVGERHQRYYPRIGEETELYLTTYQTLSRDKEHAQHLLNSRTNHAFFVIDEAHYMKQDEGIWASAVAETSRYAPKRCVLTGTPFPKSYADGINQFDVLYPQSGIFSSAIRGKIRHASERGKHGDARALLEPEIDSLYYRVRKSELHLSKPVFLPPIEVNMNPVERDLYNCIQKRIGELEQKSSDRDIETIIKLKKRTTNPTPPSGVIFGATFVSYQWLQRAIDRSRRRTTERKDSEL